jgi:hypothetical protein
MAHSDFAEVQIVVRTGYIGRVPIGLGSNPMVSGEDANSSQKADALQGGNEVNGVP